MGYALSLFFSLWRWKAHCTHSQLYSDAFAGAFKDVVSGTNPGCQTEGFVAAPGWDPVGGLGTPNFPKLLAHFLGLP